MCAATPPEHPSPWQLRVTRGFIRSLGRLSLSQFQTLSCPAVTPPTIYGHQEESTISLSPRFLPNPIPKGSGAASRFNLRVEAKRWDGMEHSK
jgi:hypothetical protein